MDDFNSKIIELASNLAEETVWNDYSDILSTKEDMFKQPGDDDYQEDCLTYKDTDELPIQDAFNNAYDYFFTEISKVFKEHKVYVIEAYKVESDELIPYNKNFNKELFMTKAEKDGRVYSLFKFQEEFNNTMINSQTDFIYVNE